MGVVVLFISTVFFEFGNGVEGNITRNETQFTLEYGLINWGHANPGLTKIAFLNFQDENAILRDSFEFSYTQKVQSRYLGFNFIAEQQETRRFRANLNQEQQKVAFLELFSSVSENFEKMQADFPFGLIPGARASSFRSGDLMGNLLSYYSSVSNLSLDSIKNQATILSVDKALERCKGVKKSKSTSVDWREVIGEYKNPVLSEVLEIISLSEKQSFSRFISDKRRFYIE